MCVCTVLCMNIKIKYNNQMNGKNKVGDKIFNNEYCIKIVGTFDNALHNLQLVAKQRTRQFVVPPSLSVSSYLNI